MPTCRICNEALDDFNISEQDDNICRICAGEEDADLNLDSNEDPII